MRTAIIINNIDNLPLLRFTETKLFFDAKNQSTNFVDDCIVVSSSEEANKLAKTLDSAVILNTGDFLTTNFRKHHQHTPGIIVAEGPDIIKFDSDTYVGFKKRCHYPQGSKQLYIIENLLKTCIRNRNLVYLDNTEDQDVALPNIPIRHLYGLASGWKTIVLAGAIGFENLESITVYDINLEQLNHAKWVHKNVSATECPIYKHVCGDYNPNAITKELWEQWNSYPVRFEQINLFDTPQFLEQSLVWISNVFKYEPTIFDLGWEMCKNKKLALTEANKNSYII